MIAHTQAVVLKTVDYSESSKIVTLFTKEHGKIAVMARGVKKPKSKLSGLLEVGHQLEVVYYYKANRSVQTITEASYLRKTLNLRLDFEKMAIAMSALELIAQLLHDEEVNEPLFSFATTFLSWLDETDIHPPLIFPYLQIRLADLMGLGLQLQPPDDAVHTQMFLNLASGLISPRYAESRSRALSTAQYQYITLALRSRNKAVFSVAFENGELKELVEYLDRFLQYHVEGLKNRRSDAIFDQILNA